MVTERTAGTGAPGHHIHGQRIPDHDQQVTRESRGVCVPEQEGGPVTAAVVTDLGEMPLSGPVSGALAATAVTLAGALDAGAGLATAAVARELRATLQALAGTQGGDDDDTADLLGRLSAPVFDGPQPAPGDVRPTGGGGGGDARH